MKRLFKRILPELVRLIIIGAFLAPFAYTASGDKLSFDASPALHSRTAGPIITLQHLRTLILIADITITHK